MTDKEMREIARGHAEAFGYTCQLCGRRAKQLCQDGTCEDCHVSLGFRECIDGSWVAEVRRKAGLR